MCWVSFRVEDLHDLRKHIHIDRNMIFLWREKKFMYWMPFRVNPIRPRGGGFICPPPAMFLHISLQIHVQARWKNLTSPNYKFGRGQYAFYPVKLSRFAEKKWCSSETPEFLRGDPYELGRRPLQPMKIYKSQLLSRGVLVIQTSWICLNMAKHS